MASLSEGTQSFRTLLFEYLKTLVPHWRISDEAWQLGGGNLVGIGIERNYGGQLMIIPWPAGSSLPHPSWPDIEPALRALGKAADRVIIVADDRDGRPHDRQSSPFVEILWSERERLKDYVVRDRP